MNRFAFMLHPVDPKRDVRRKFPFLARALSERQINFFSGFFPPVFLSEIEGLTSAESGEKALGWLLACPLTPARMFELPVQRVYRKIIQTGRMAERLGAQILGLGAFTSVIGDGGLTVARSLDIPVTTGDAYTIAIAVETLREAARLLGVPLAMTPVAVVGATGAIGRVCAQILADEAGHLLLVGRDPPGLDALRSDLRAAGALARLDSTTDLTRVRTARLILTATSSLSAILMPEHFAPGSVVCDVARPRDVSPRVAADRKDVLVIDGGMVTPPGQVDFHFDFGFPPGRAYACMAETMALALEGRMESFSLGKHITRLQVEEIANLARKHGFRLSGFRSFERQVTPEQINTVRDWAHPLRATRSVV